MLYHFMNKRLSDGSARNRLPTVTRQCMDFTDPKERIKIYQRREEEEAKAQEWRKRRFVLKENRIVNEIDGNQPAAK